MRFAPTCVAALAAASLIARGNTDNHNRHRRFLSILDNPERERLDLLPDQPQVAANEATGSWYQRWDELNLTFHG